MKTYPPFHADPREQHDSFKHEAPDGYEPPSDAQLITYVERYWQEFRAVAERYFGDLAAALPLYAKHPYSSTVVRLGPNGVIIGHKPAAVASVRVLPVEDFDPPLVELWTIFTIQERLEATLLSFDFRFASYSEDVAREAGARAAFEQALSVFWHVLEPSRFEELCKNLVVAEGVRIHEVAQGDLALDVVGHVYFDEPSGFVREETWGFELRHYIMQRPSAALVREVEATMEGGAVPVDVLCLISSGDLTSIGRHVAVASPRIRVWDRAVLDRLLHRHPEVMQRYFQPYADALAQIQSDWASDDSHETRFLAALQRCPTGQRDFREYEEIGLEVLRFLFPVELGDPRVQARTDDGVERRDVVSRNNRQSRFFQRVGERFDADFIIWDFKNYGEPITGEVINDVATYANPALGRFIVVVSRKGGSDSSRAAQLRRLRNDHRMILVVSDEQFLEMARRKEAGAAPEDVLEDLLDELLLAF